MKTSLSPNSFTSSLIVTFENHGTPDMRPI